MERLSTGIRSLDELIDGGIPLGSSVLIAGGPGTGKSILAMQIVYNRLKAGDNVVYLSLDSSPNKLIHQTDSFGWKFDEFLKDSSLALLSPRVDRINLMDTLDDIKKSVSEKQRKVVVVDSITKMMDIGYFPIEEKDSEVKVRERNITRQDMSRFIISLEKIFKGLDVTLFFVGESDMNGVNITKDGIAEFECDGVIRLNLINLGEEERTLQITKMRATKIDTSACDFQFTPNGIEISPDR